VSASREQRLDSWKEIAKHLGREVRTVIRWEHEKGLPVHRVPGGKRQGVYAYRTEIDAWLGSGAGHKLEALAPGAPQQNGENPAVGFHALPNFQPALGPQNQPVIPTTESLSAPVLGTQAGRQVAHYRVPRWHAVCLSIIVMGAGVLAFLLSRPLSEPKIIRTFQVTNDGREKMNIATDGARVYFSEVIGGRMVLAQVSVTGGETAVIPTPFENTLLDDVSPELAELLVVGVTGAPSGPWYGPLYALPLVGSSPRRLGDLNGYDSSASWSPDGQQMVFVKEHDLFLAKGDGTQPNKLVRLPGGVPFLLRWSPDGTRLRFFIREESSNSNTIWEVSTNGSNLHTVLPGWHNPPGEHVGNWTPDGKYFLFGSERQGMHNLWALREEGGLFGRANHKPVQLTTGPMQLSNPILSPKGNRMFALAGHCGVKP